MTEALHRTPAQCRKLAGARQSHRARSTGAVVTVYDAAAQDLDDPDCGRWLIICENHGCILYMETLRDAREIAVRPEIFCDDCRELLHPLNTGNGVPSKEP